MRLGLVATYMSEYLISGFTSGVAIHVLTSQMKHILGINIQRHNGVLKIIKVGIYRELLKFILYSVIKRETISFRRNIYNSIPLSTLLNFLCLPS
jgi:MFS superfamily sulfate permease-like transporter